MMQNATIGPTATQTAPELLDVDDLTKLLKCSARHVYRLADAGKLPRPLKLGTLVRWRRAEILEWIEAGCPAVRTVRGGRP